MFCSHICETSYLRHCSLYFFGYSLACMQPSITQKCFFAVQRHSGVFFSFCGKIKHLTGSVLVSLSSNTSFLCRLRRGRSRLLSVRRAQNGQRMHQSVFLKNPHRRSSEIHTVNIQSDKRYTVVRLVQQKRKKIYNKKYKSGLVVYCGKHIDLFNPPVTLGSI